MVLISDIHQNKELVRASQLIKSLDLQRIDQGYRRPKITCHCRHFCDFLATHATDGHYWPRRAGRLIPADH